MTAGRRWRGGAGGAGVIVVLGVALLALPAVAPAQDPPDPSVAYVMDVSESTGGPGGACGDPNSDGAPDTILDCEIAGSTRLHESVIPYSPLPAGVITFHDTATTLDVQPVSGFQPQTDVAADLDFNGINDVVEQLESGMSGGGTDFDAALDELADLASSSPTVLQAVLVSGSDAAVATGPGTALQANADAGTVIDTFAVGTGTAGCGPGAALRTIADATGGTCTEVSDPSQLGTGPGWFSPPDADGDGVHDGADGCPTESGPADQGGCPPPPDGDADGVPDASDPCPAQPGPAGSDGCPPPPDTDADGVPDASDPCPAQPGPAGSDGCPPPPDADGDGIPDAEDGCPTVAGLPAARGCPLAPVDVTAPGTTLVRVKISHRRRRATFRFTSTEPGVTYRCKLDRRPWRACRSPRTYRRLKRGTHRFRVAARDAAGNLDRTPAHRRFRVR